VKEARYLVFSKWYHLAILELCLCRGFQRDPRWIASTLTPPITPDEAEAALELLLEIGLLQDACGRLQPVYELLAGEDYEPEEFEGASATPSKALPDPSPERLDELAFYKLYQWFLRRADAAMVDFHYQERFVNGATVAIPRAYAKDLFKRLEVVQQEIITEAAKAGDAPDIVYHVAFQCFPLSDPTEG